MKKTQASLWVIMATLLTVLTLFLLPYTPKIAVNTTTVERGTLYKTSLMEGVLQYDEQQAIISLSSGMVAEVCVNQGDFVPAGTLLVRLDSAVEEASLQTIIANQNDFSHLVETMAVANDATYDDFLLAQVLALEQNEQAVRLSIETKQIRASNDCIIGPIYVSPSDYVDANTLLGSTHAETKVVTVNQLMNDTATREIGSMAILSSSDQKNSTIGTLIRISSPILDQESNQYWQTLTYEPLDELALSQFSIGSSITVETIDAYWDEEVLIPISAVDTQNRVWKVEQGVATSVQISVDKMNRQYVTGDETLVGASLVIDPESLSLYQNCPVKEQAQ